MSEDLAVIAADIVAAFVSNNSVPVRDIGQLIQNVHGALSGLDSAAPVETPAPPQPFVPVRSSIKNDHLVCLVCGTKQKTLKRHLNSAHNLTPQHYRETYELKPDYPMTSPAYTKTRSEMAKNLGLGRKPKAAVKTK